MICAHYVNMCLKREETIGAVKACNHITIKQPTEHTIDSGSGYYYLHFSPIVSAILNRRTVSNLARLEGRFIICESQLDDIQGEENKQIQYKLPVPGL